MAHRVLARASNLSLFRVVNQISPAVSSRYYSPGDDLGRGSGKGGGSGGSIRDAGGAFGKREAGLEEEYFHRLQKDQLAKLQHHLHEEIEHHQDQLKHHQEAIEDIKKRMKDLTKDKK